MADACAPMRTCSVNTCAADRRTRHMVQGFASRTGRWQTLTFGAARHALAVLIPRKQQLGGWP